MLSGRRPASRQGSRPPAVAGSEPPLGWGGSDPERQFRVTTVPLRLGNSTNPIERRSVGTPVQDAVTWYGVSEVGEVPGVTESAAPASGPITLVWTVNGVESVPGALDRLSTRMPYLPGAGAASVVDTASEPSPPQATATFCPWTSL